MPSFGRVISYSAVYVQFKKLLRLCNIDPTNIALHSPRIGGATEAFQSKKVPKRLIDRQGRWKNSKTKYKYARETNAEVANIYSYIKY